MTSRTTEDLIRQLAEGLQPVRLGGLTLALRRNLLLAALFSAALAVGLLGLRQDLLQVLDEPMLWVKWLYPLSLALIAWRLAVRLASPGADPGPWAWRIALPLTLMAALALVSLFSTPTESRAGLLWGQTWDVCTVNIVLLSLPLFAATCRALRQGATVRPRLVGTGAGLLSGGVGAAIYGLHCPEMAAPFLLVWNGLALLLMALMGAALGPRLFRW